MWGKDFQPDEHKETVRRSEEKGYRPTVDVFLPVCKEPLDLLSNTWRHVSALDYPSVNVFVLDDGKSEEVKALATTFGFECEKFVHKAAVSGQSFLFFGTSLLCGSRVVIIFLFVHVKTNSRVDQPTRTLRTD